MQNFNKLIDDYDLSLFEKIFSQTTDEDKTALLQIQNLVRARGEYIYLEIGSHLGGTLQPYYQDHLCKIIYSIDKRPASQPDERGMLYHYDDNTSTRMMDNLRCNFPEVNEKKVQIFDCDIKDLKAHSINYNVDLVFIDGEHTNKAVFRDFKESMKFFKNGTVIAFHDTQYVFKAINKIKAYLDKANINFKGVMLGGCVYVIFI